MKQAVRYAWMMRLALLAAVFVTAWVLLYDLLSWAFLAALLITVVCLFPSMLVPWPWSRMGLRYGLATGLETGRDTYLELAAKCAAAGDHAEQISLLRALAGHADPEAYQLLLTVLAEHGSPADVSDLRRSVLRYSPEESPLFKPWPGLDGPGLLGHAQDARRTGDPWALRSLALLLDAAGMPDPEIWRRLVDARVGGFHGPLARHLADTGRLDEAVELMRVGPDGSRPNFLEVKEFLRERELDRQLEDEARRVWDELRVTEALVELRQLLDEQGRLDELAALPEPAPSRSSGGAPEGRWPGFSANLTMPSPGYQGPTFM
ncbi:hypothetical protein AB0C29_26730 [Actinoplanes sp. NPDC048791]|uniref:tetratricopeptide repeat protein n=1 Tax=Actinoplanes sp. NPDC048791 TaxID=3154623 RepID=UPI0033F7BEB8